MAVLHIQLSHFFAAETFQTLFTTTSLYFMVQVVRRGRLRDSLWAGVFVGLAMATKVSSAPILVPLALAHMSSPHGGRRRCTRCPSTFLPRGGGRRLP